MFNFIFEIVPILPLEGLVYKLRIHSSDRAPKKGK